MHTQLPISQSHSELQIEETKPDQLSRRQMIKLALSTVILGGFGTMPAQVIPQSIVNSKAGEVIKKSVRNYLTNKLKIAACLELSPLFGRTTDNGEVKAPMRWTPGPKLTISKETEIDAALNTIEHLSAFSGWVNFYSIVTYPEPLDKKLYITNSINL